MEERLRPVSLGPNYWLRKGMVRGGVEGEGYGGSCIELHCPGFDPRRGALRLSFVPPRLPIPGRLFGLLHSPALEFLKEPPILLFALALLLLQVQLSLAPLRHSYFLVNERLLLRLGLTLAQLPLGA